MAFKPFFHFSSPKTTTGNSGLMHWHWIAQTLNSNMSESIKQILEKVNLETSSQLFTLKSIENKLD